MDFYNKNYTTNNLYVAIVDSKNIEEMIKLYVPYFNEIEKKVNKNKFEIDKFENNIKLDFIVFILFHWFQLAKFIKPFFFLIKTIQIINEI